MSRPRSRTSARLGAVLVVAGGLLPWAPGTAHASDGAMLVTVGTPALQPGGEYVRVPVTLRCVPTSISTGTFGASVQVRQTTGSRSVQGERVLFSTECDGVARAAVLWVSSRPGPVRFRPGMALVSVRAYQINQDSSWLLTVVDRRAPLRPATAKTAR